MFSLTENFFKNEDKKRQKDDQKKWKKNNNNNVNPKWKKETSILLAPLLYL